MLRNALLGFALLVALTGLALVLCGQPESWPLVGWGAGLFVVILIERWRYERHEHGAEQGWQSTGEQFVDLDRVLVVGREDDAVEVLLDELEAILELVREGHTRDDVLETLNQLGYFTLFHFVYLDEHVIDTAYRETREDPLLRTGRLVCAVCAEHVNPEPVEEDVLANTLSTPSQCKPITLQLQVSTWSP